MPSLTYVIRNTQNSILVPVYCCCHFQRVSLSERIGDQMGLVGMVLRNNLASTASSFFSLPLFFCSVSRRDHIWKHHQSPVDAIAVRLNRVIKIVGLSPLPSATRDSANNMARCLMTRSITAPCPASEANDTTSRAHTRASLSSNGTRNEIEAPSPNINARPMSVPHLFSFASDWSILRDYSLDERFLTFSLVYTERF